MKTDPKRLSEIQRIYRQGAAIFSAISSEDSIKKNGGDIVQVREKFISFLSPSSRILDIGCGDGRDAKFFLQKGCRVVGVDICEPFIAELQKTKEGEFLLGDIVDRESPAYQRQYDAVWSNCSLVHLERSEAIQVMRNCFSVLGQGGYFFVETKYDAKKTHIEQKESKTIPGSIKTYLYYTENDIRQDLQDAGFQILETGFRQSPGGGDMFIRLFCKK